MKINIHETLKEAKDLLEKEKNISPALKALVKLLLTIIKLLSSKLGLNSKNSSKPPSTDPNRQKNKKNSKPKGLPKKPGGQPGRARKNLEPFEDPDQIIPIQLDQRTLPKGRYHEVGFESRQVVEIEISRIVKEYRAQILEDEEGHRYVAHFPEGVSRPVQYGQSIKAHAVYLSQFQLIPYGRVADYFINEISIPLSVGSIFNFNQEGSSRLDEFDILAKEKLKKSSLLNADETGINMNGERMWLHAACNEKWTYFYPHKNRGAEAMNEVGILPHFKGILVHDHWKPYYTYRRCKHGLCHAHHIRELQWVIVLYVGQIHARSFA